MNARREFAVDPAAQSGPDQAVPSVKRTDTGRLRGALLTTGALAGTWAALHWAEPASWVIGAPTALLGGVATMLLPASKPPRLSISGAVQFAAFGAWGILRGALDVSRRSLRPASLHPGLLRYRTTLPDGRPRRLFALSITLMPGTLTASLEGDLLVVHALDAGGDARSELAALERRIADLFDLYAMKDVT
ncbi:Na+/H+ antiporter subunit E [Histidinibacterium aquaticum]|uniref:Cation transporter n=1 Tax=Histidinibacterium aquaticum TaxID=2613962 RepID=A0A5J5GC61_9RHOB|nr:Na+/H+ antiporter subunit E [Histidinibacterium aquaticum]KAA9005759.1 cation transporter [Histidinibacterium aquaticum]